MVLMIPPAIISDKQATLRYLANQLGVALPSADILCDFDAALMRIYEAAGVPTPAPALRSSPQHAANNLMVTVLGDGGGDEGTTPDWVPTDATVYIDFAGDRAWVQDTGEVEIDTLLGTDGENGFTYNAAKIVADVGYQDEDGVGTELTYGYPAFIGDLFTAVIAGATVVLSLVLEDNERLNMELGTSDFNTTIDLQTGQGGGFSATKIISVISGGDTLETEEDLITNPSGIIKVAANLKAHIGAAADCAFAVNGGEVILLQRPDAWALPFNFVGLYVFNAPTIQSIAVYDPVLVGELPALSA